MSDSYECSTCGSEFDSEKAREQHRRAKHDEGSAPRSPSGRSWTAYALVAAGLVLVGGTALFWWSPLGERTKYPSQGDHWHADYTIVLCGEKVPPRPYSKGGIHTHGKGQIHVHPHSPSTTGKKANLAKFFGSFNGELTAERIAVPMYGTYENGDNCNGSAGEVAVFVNDKRIKNPTQYVVQDGDSVRITFQPR